MKHSEQCFCDECSYILLFSERDIYGKVEFFSSSEDPESIYLKVEGYGHDDIREFWLDKAALIAALSK